MGFCGDDVFAGVIRNRSSFNVETMGKALFTIPNGFILSDSLFILYIIQSATLSVSPGLCVLMRLTAILITISNPMLNTQDF